MGNRIATATPKVAKDILATIDPALDAALKAAYATHKDRGLKGADLTRAMIATGHLPNEGKGTKDPVATQGLKVRTYMRSHGAWVGRGRTYGMTYAEARRVAVGFIEGIDPPKGVRYAKGQRVEADATPAEVAGS